ncbi:MAG TPA: sugar transferase [Chloroflexi bacterium]|nr:sugar transferase [Chloroflexota bacterium]
MELSQPPLHHEAFTIPWYERFNPNRRLLRGQAYFRVKRALDLLLCILALPFLLAAFALCALLIKLDSPGGPILFRQQRTGRAGRRFWMYKFRTMVPNAEEMKQQLIHLNELQWPDFKITDDPRITRVGRLLRKTSLDELPQIVNVVKGDMSLVGPRPTSFDHNTYRLWQTERLDVVPGITGLWQIVGRAETEFDERLRLDIAYIERQSIWFDINILTRTILAVFEGRGAH